ncbi:hypothetical protein [Actinoplanes subtropicus]|nr:hypothetical protein [Actinoplanes subtropicus]
MKMLLAAILAAALPVPAHPPMTWQPCGDDAECATLVAPGPSGTG